MMVNEKSILAQIAKEVANALRPLTGDSATTSSDELPEFFKVLLDGIGIELDKAIGAAETKAIKDALADITAAIKRILPILDREEPPSLDETQTIIEVIGSATQALSLLNNLNLRAYEARDILVDLKDLGTLLFEYLIATYLLDYHTHIFNLLLSAGIVKLGNVRARKLEDRLPRVQFALIGELVRNAKEYPKIVYKWGTPDFRPYDLLSPLLFLLRTLEFPALIADPLPTVAQMIGWNPAIAPDVEVRLPLVREETANLKAGLAVVPLRTSTGAPQGLAIVPYGVGSKSEKRDAGNDWELNYGFSGSVSGRYGIIIGFQKLEVKSLDGTTNPVDYTLQLRAGLRRKGAPGTRMFLFGEGDTAVVEVGKMGVDMGIAVQNGKGDFFIEFAVEDGQVRLSKGKGDGFLQKVLPEKGITSPFAVTVGLSKDRGLYFRGGAGLAVTLPIHKDILGVIKIQTIDLAIVAKGDDQAGSQIELMAAVSAGLKLGPFNASVERIGIRSDLTFPESGGNLGVANLALGFKPPDGAGMVIDSTAIVGGGYLLFDSKNEQYAGILQLEIKGGISLKAIGLLTTRMPDGSKGFSLLVIITGEFPPIPLGFGFTLNGVGGLLGVNRTMVLEVLRAGVKNRTLDSIMFPQDPVKNAQKIISDLQSVFPPVSGRFVFGPMAILAWGKPATILTIELGIILELPSPVRLAIMGQLTMVLPSKEVPAEAQVAVLRMDVLGTIEFEKGDAAIDATIYDSRIAAFPITGDMAMRLNWGASPAFALSAGGFNPRFQPPPSFPSLGRMAIALATGDNPRLRLEAYLALTTNTLQFGARLDVYAEQTFDIAGFKNTFSVAAWLGFDALVNFQPFSFLVDIDGQAVLKHNGNPLLPISLHLSLSGPQPWLAVGEVTFDFVGKRQIPINLRIGEEPAQAPSPPGDPLGELKKALQDPRNWSAQMPGDGHTLVTLRKIEVSKELLVHPFGELTVRQKVVPLEVEIAKFGSTTPASRGPFKITSIRFGTQTTEQARDEVRDHFAPGQFFDLSDEEKLSLPAFQPLPSGCTRIGTKEISFSSVQLGASFQYDTVVIDNKEELKSRKGKGFEYEMAKEVLVAVAALGAAGQSAMRSTGSAKFAGSHEQRVTFKYPEYAVARKDDLAREATFESYVEAEAARRQKDAASASYQTVGRHEVV